MTQDQAVAAAGSLTGWQRDILAHCTISEPLKFNRYAKTGYAYREVVETGRILASLGLATVKWVRDDLHDDGDGIWLNEDGEQVRQAALTMKDRECGDAVPSTSLSRAPSQPSRDNDDHP